MERADGCRGGEVVGGDLGGIRDGLWVGESIPWILERVARWPVFGEGVNGLKSREYIYI